MSVKDRLGEDVEMEIAGKRENTSRKGWGGLRET
jgi:hypothetical protein